MTGATSAEKRKASSVKRDVTEFNRFTRLIQLSEENRELKKENTDLKEAIFGYLHEGRNEATVGDGEAKVRREGVRTRAMTGATSAEKRKASSVKRERAKQRKKMGEKVIKLIKELSKEELERKGILVPADLHKSALLVSMSIQRGNTEEEDNETGGEQKTE